MRRNVEMGKHSRGSEAKKDKKTIPRASKTGVNLPLIQLTFSFEEFLKVAKTFKSTNHKRKS